MIKYILLFTITLSSFNLNAQQDIEKELDAIEDESSAENFIEEHKKTSKGKLITFNTEKHKTRFAEELFKLSKGGKKVYKTDVDKTYYKVIDKVETPYFRLSYIVIKRQDRTDDEIIKIQNNIIDKYSQGYRFEDLAKHFSEDITAKKGGDIGWVTTGDLHPNFEIEIRDNDYQVNDIFTVNVSDQDLYYVAIKTSDIKLIKEIKVLKVTEPLK